MSPRDANPDRATAAELSRVDFQDRPAVRWRRRVGRRGDEGSVAVEVAGFVLPVMLLAVIAVAAAFHLSIARLDVQSAAASAARAASLQRNATAAFTAAWDAAQADLTGRAITCAYLDVAVDTSRFTRGGSVTVTVTCQVDLSTLTRTSGIPGHYTASATSTSPIDTYRQVVAADLPVAVVP
jgi:Flp pilus assembly protein TadG